MRALAGWVLALSLVASPALAAGSGDANGAGSGASNGATSTTKDNSGSTASATANADASSLETEIGDLRDLIDSQANQLEKQNDKLQQEQKKLDTLEEQLKASSTDRNSGSSTPASAVSVTSSAPASSPVATATATMPTIPAASSPAPAPAAQPQQGNGAPPPSPLFFRIGSATFTPLGFIDLTDAWRSPVVGSGIGTNFGSLPYRIAGNFPGSGLTENRMSLQNSRIGVRIDSTVFGGQAIGYLETDFLGNAPTNISVSSNSAVLRLRVFFLDYTKGKIEILGGQDWSMLTPNRKGIDPIPGNIFFSQDMDTNYQVGLVWERTPQFRFIYHASKAATFGISLENAEQYLGGGNGASNSPVTPAGFSTGQFETGGSGVNIPNLIPDIVVKAAFDPMVMKRNFHFEVSGLFKEFRANTFISSSNTSINSKASGGAVSANVNLEIFKNFHLIANSYWSDGGGQKIFGLAPDVVIHAQADATSPFTISPVHSGSGIAGAEWQVMPKMMIYGYYGGVYISRDFFACGASTCGYGVPASDGISQSAAYGQNRVVQEGTIGFVPVFWRSPNYGALQLITQYSYLSRNPWSVVSGGLTPRVAHGSMAFVDLRYVLP